MILDLDNEMRALQSHEIRTHKDALKYFTVRYSSFTTPNYPLDAPLPAFALAEHGFHFDSYTRAIKCVTCDYTNTDLFDDLLLSVLNKHLRASPHCEQARSSLKVILNENVVVSQDKTPPLFEAKFCGSAIGSAANRRPMATSRASIAAVAAAAINKQFATEDARIKSFENEKLIIGIAKLAANGLYRVPKQDMLLLSNSKDKTANKKSFVSGGINKAQMGKLSLTRGDQMKINDQEEGDEEMSSGLNDVSQTSQIEAIAKSLPTLYHVRCAYCPYECLLFKTSLLNTLYKSPFDEHREKFGSRCPIFALNSDLASSSKTLPKGFDLHRDLAFSFAKEKNIPQPDLMWLQTLYEFESTLSTSNQIRRVSSMRNLNNTSISDPATSIISSKNQVLSKNLVSNSDDGQDVELREIPKVIEKLYEIYNQPASSAMPLDSLMPGGSGGAALSNPLVYVPGSAGGKNVIKSMTTSDFSQLQSVLNKSDNVLSRKAHHPDYAQYQARLDSFKEWPASMSQQPSDLAKAGFYYFGIKDMVKCFFCNGGLKNWDHNDDPFQDHVRWFPACQYIRQLMGHEYIETVREKFKNMESGFSDENSSSNDRSSERGDRFNHGSSNSQHSTFTNRPTGSSSSTGLSSSWSSNTHHQNSSSSQQQHQRSVSPRTLNSRMDSYMVRRILDHNLISRESIRNAYEVQLSSPSSSSLYHSTSSVRQQSSSSSSLYNDDFHSPIEMALASYSIDRNKRFKAENFEHLADFIIFNLSPKVTVSAIVGFVYVKYGLYPMSVRIIREHGQGENRCFVLVSLQPKDRRHLNDIIKDLSKNSNELVSLRTKMPIVVARTAWNEIEERFKSLLDKPIAKPVATVSTIETYPPTPTRSLSLGSAGDRTPENSVKINDEAMDVTQLTLTSGVKEDEIGKNGDDASTPVDDALQLKEENERLKNERLCVVCLGREKNVLFLPCAHLTACLECSLSLQNCPMCRSKIQATVRTFT